MIFTHLEMTNFKSHKHSSIDFNQGITMILGENGAGKSTIFEAINFALYKPTSMKYENLIRKNKDLDEKIKMEVSLDFISNGVEYRIVRGKNKSKVIAEIYRKDKSTGEYQIIVSGNKDVNVEIENIIEMDRELFLNAIYVKQGEIAALVEKGPSERKKLIGQLLKIEDLEKAWNESLPLINVYKSKKDKLEGRIEEDSDLKKQYKELLEKESNLKDRQKEFEQTIISKDNSLKEISNRKDILEKEKLEYEKLNLNLNNEKNNLETLNKDKLEISKKLEEIESAENEMKILEPYTLKLPIYNEFKESLLKLKDLRKEESRLKDTLGKIEENENIISSQKENYENYKSLNSELDILNTKKSSLEGELKLLKQFENDRENTIKEIEKSNLSMDKFFAELNDLFKKLSINIDLDSLIADSSIDLVSDELNIELKTNNEYLSSLEEIESLENEEDFHKLKDIADDLRIINRENISSVESSINSLKEESISLKQEMKSIEDPLKEIRQVENKCPVCQSDIDDAKKEELIDHYESTIKNNSLRIKEINAKLSILENLLSVLEQNNKILEIILTNINSNRFLISKLSELNDKLNDLNKKIESLKEKAEEFESISKIIETKKEEHEKLKENYDRYIAAETILKSLGEKHKIVDALYPIQGNISHEEETLKSLISQDSKLSLEISMDELNENINNLNGKNQRYIQLSGQIKAKDEYALKLESKNKEIEDKEKLIEELQKAIKSSKYDVNEYNDILALVERITEALNSSIAKLGEIKGQLRSTQEQIGSSAERIEQNKAYQAEHDSLEKYIELLEYIRSLYYKDGIQKELRLVALPIIQRNTKEFFEQFNFNYSDLKIDDEYNISIYGPEGESNLDMVSGGEKIAIALALRLGITQAMASGSIETILLDEPTIFLDNTRRGELINLLNNMSVLPQMIIVTHDDDLKQAASTILEVRKENGISTIKLGEE